MAHNARDLQSRSKKMAPSASTQAATLERFLDAWKRWDASAWLATFADDFTQVTLPFGMKVPSRDRTQVEQVLPKLMKVVQDYKVRTHSAKLKSIVGEKRRKKKKRKKKRKKKS